MSDIHVEHDISTRLPTLGLGIASDCHDTVHVLPSATLAAYIFSPSKPTRAGLDCRFVAIAAHVAQPDRSHVAQIAVRELNADHRYTAPRVLQLTTDYLYKRA